MEDVIKVLKQIVSSFSSFGSVPKPVQVCIALFGGVFGFSLIFVYARLDKKQLIMLVAAIAIMVVVTGVYYLWKTITRKKSEEDFWGDAPEASASAPTRPASSSSTDAPARQPLRSSVQDAPARQYEASAEYPYPAKETARRPGSSLTLLELVEPLFQYVCRLNRIARRGPTARSGETTSFMARPAAASSIPTRAAGLDEVVVRSEMKALLEDLQNRAAGDPRLSHQLRKIELPLIFFVDSMISESSLPFAAQWNQNRLAYDLQELAGDEKFFDLLDETLKESGEEAAERLAVFYICIGLGFTGIYFKQPELLRKTMLGIAPRIRHLVENDQTARMCPEAYQSLDTRDLVQPPSSRMALAGLLLAACTVAVLISYFFLYRQASANLNHSIEEVLQQDLAVDSPK